MIYILISGQKGAGKTTVGNALKNEFLNLGVSTLELNIADYLKHACSKVSKIDLSLFYTAKDQPIDIHPLSLRQRLHLARLYSITNVKAVKLIRLLRNKSFSSLREMLQYIGTEVLREIEPDCHIRMFEKLARRSNAQVIVCSDVRFLNEKKAFPHCLHIHVNRLSLASDTDLHKSEVYAQFLLKKADIVINNPGNVPGLSKEFIKNGLLGRDLVSTLRNKGLIA